MYSSFKLDIGPIKLNNITFVRLNSIRKFLIITKQNCLVIEPIWVWRLTEKRTVPVVKTRAKFSDRQTGVYVPWPPSVSEPLPNLCLKPGGEGTDRREVLRWECESVRTNGRSFCCPKDSFKIGGATWCPNVDGSPVS